MAKNPVKLTIDQKLDSLIQMFKSDSLKKDRRMDKMDDRFEKMEDRFIVLEKLLESLANFTTSNFNRVDDQLAIIIKRLDLHQDYITDIKRMVIQLVQAQARRDRFEVDTDRRLTKLETKFS